MDATEQLHLDRIMQELDGADNKARLGPAIWVFLWQWRKRRLKAATPLWRYIGGANAKTLPVPMMNIVNGGAHADNPIDVQEFMIMPVAAENIKEAVRMGASVPYAERVVE